MSEASAPRNHALAWRMAGLASLSQNITTGCLWGSFSVMLSSVESRLHITREMSSLAVPLVSIGMAFLSPVVGVLVTRYSLRLLMLLGVCLSILGYILLAITSSYPLYLAAYTLCMGPGMCLAGGVLPSTLIARWFHIDRGRALGLVHTPIVIVVMPLVSSWIYEHHGAMAVYLTLAAITCIGLLPFVAMVKDQPPGESEAGSPAGAAHRDGEGSQTLRQLLGNFHFWVFGISSSSLITGAMLLTTHLVPMAASWGFVGAMAASLLAIQSLVGVAGPPIYGWVADRLGGGRTMALLAFNSALLWALLTLPLPFIGKAIVIGLIGLQGAAAMPVLAMALSEHFDAASFSRAFGLGTTLTLPLAVVGVQGAAIAYTQTGSYNWAVASMVGLFALIVPLALLAHRSAKPNN